MFRGILDHIRNCRTIRQLLRDHDSLNLRELYWYDMRLSEAVRLWGILRVIRSALFSGNRDAIASNYGLQSLYRADPPECGSNESNAPVWNCRSLVTRAWFDERNELCRALEEKADAIIAEYHAIAHRIGDHPDNASLAPRGRWTGLHLFGVEGKNEELCALCPVTTEVVERFPVCLNFGFVMFSGAEPGTHIAMHRGASNLRQRNHLGIEVPEPDACRIRVGSEWRHWAQSRTLSFDDSYEHEVVHNGSKDRVILSVDLWHPSLSPEDTDLLSHPVFRRFGYAAT